jgi:SAM-dependent methyltransferase
MKDKQCEWFENWFDTQYYHILYKERDYQEAANFIDALIRYLSPKPGSNFLDLACGKGRHSIYLNLKGFNVTGIDLSQNSIEFAKQSASATLKFLLHDMRDVLPQNKFDYIVNLFTSFGYFSDPNDDKLVIKMVKQALKPGGIFVLDYFNFGKSHLNFGNSFTKNIDSIQFDISKHIDNGRIIKEIEVTHNSKKMRFEEQVRIYSLQEFKQLLSLEGLTLVNTFGNYALEPFDEHSSERMILIARN